eukprot:SAG25_NODE_4130_length_883_cov_1.383929_2_plen_126_part_00
MDATGVETVRRDNCELVRNTMTVALDMILKERNGEPIRRSTKLFMCAASHAPLLRTVNGAITFVKHKVSQLLQNELDLGQLVITKGYTKKAEDYDAKQGHVELALKMKERDPLTAPVRNISELDQ